MVPVKSLVLRITGATTLAIAMASSMGCVVTSLGAESRAHGEEAAMRKLLNRDDTFETVVKVAVKRGYQCNDETNDGRAVVCQKQMDLRVIGCKWYVHLFKAKSARGDVFDINSYRACD